MKLPSNALIFLTSLGVEFSINFLNRCRVNALDGEKVSKSHYVVVLVVVCTKRNNGLCIKIVTINVFIK